MTTDLDRHSASSSGPVKLDRADAKRRFAAYRRWTHRPRHPQLHLVDAGAPSITVECPGQFVPALSCQAWRLERLAAIDCDGNERIAADRLQPETKGGWGGLSEWDQQSTDWPVQLALEPDGHRRGVPPSVTEQPI